MGVIKTRREITFSTGADSVDDVLTVATDPEDDDFDIPVVPARNPVHVSVPRRRCRLPTRPEDLLRPLRGSKVGAKKKRRYENNSELIKLGNDEDFEAISIDDFRPNKVSAFGRVLNEAQLMEIWNDFINVNEDQQQEVLKTNNKTGNKNEEKNIVSSLEPDEAFRRIKKDLRNVLKQKHVPVGIIQSLEEELTDFFKGKPTAIYISEALPSFHRMLLHALCQYNTLVSQSIEKDGCRRVRVDNPQPSFCPPSSSLANYLAEIHHKHNN